MIPSRIIEKKRDGGSLTRGEVQDFFSGYLDGRVSEYQMAAALMAVYYQGLDSRELEALVSVMVESGRVLDLSHLPGARIDKHSTGGVGDKVSLVLAPLLAELGVYVPMMSGRGLGHTAGTLDKLEAIPGFRTDLPLDRFTSVLEEVGCAMIGQTSEIAPLDRRLYDLRSVTGTVPSIPLISASIMSKKLAEGLTGLVLDVKAGSGAFLTEMEDTLTLARTMVGIGDARGVPTVALVTAMDRPLGRAVGNGLETREALECLSGKGPRDLVEVVTALAGEMLVLAGEFDEAEAGRREAARVLSSGEPGERFARLIEAQDGDPRVVERPELLEQAPVQKEVPAPRAGVVRGVAPRPLGEAVVELGGGRTALGQDIDLTVGFVLSVQPGDRVDEGDPLGTVHAASDDDASQGAAALAAAVDVGDEAGDELLPLVSHRVTAQGVREL